MNKICLLIKRGKNGTLDGSNNTMVYWYYLASFFSFKVAIPALPVSQLRIFLFRGWGTKSHLLIIEGDTGVYIQTSPQLQILLNNSLFTWFDFVFLSPQNKTFLMLKYNYKFFEVTS